MAGTLAAALLLVVLLASSSGTPRASATSNPNAQNTAAAAPSPDGTQQQEQPKLALAYCNASGTSCQSICSQQEHRVASQLHGLTLLNLKNGFFCTSRGLHKRTHATV